MTPSQRFTAPAALLLGAAVGLAGIQTPSGDQASTPAKVAASPDARSTAHRSTTGTRPTASAGSYIAGWNSLKDGQLPKKERIALQCAILQEWAVVDLSAAIRAVVADQESRLTSRGVNDPMREALRAGIAAQPDLAWHLIESHAFGLHTRWIRDAWIKAVGPHDPMKVLRRSPHFSPSERDVVMRIATESTFAPAQPDTAGEEFVSLVLTLPNQPDLPPRKSLIYHLRHTVEKSSLLDRVRQAQHPEIRRVYLEAYLGFNAMKPELPEGESEPESEDEPLPPEIREEVEQILRDQPELRWGG